MLDTNNHKNSPCAYAEQIVSYLYDEAEAREKTLFETHLKSCADCAEEFAGFSTIRSSVLEWRREEFSPLQIPAIEIPYAKNREFYKPGKNSEFSHLWFGKIRELFSLSPVLTASASFAIIAVCLVVLFFTYKSSNEVTAGNNLKNTGQTVSPQKANKEEASDVAMAEDSAREVGGNSSDNEPNSLVAATKNNQKPISSAAARRKDSVVKVLEVARISDENPHRELSARKIKPAIFENKNQTVAQTGKLPRLNNFEEYEDKSLRLAELLDDDGAK